MSICLSVAAVKDPTVIDKVSCAAYQAIASIQQQRPEWLVDKYRNIPPPQYKSVFIHKLTATLSLAEDQDTLISKLSHFLRSLLLPSFFESASFSKLLNQINLLVPVDLEPRKADSIQPQQTAIATNEKPPEAREAIAILLLDAENLQLNSETEKFLAQVCNYPIQVKIAFANWRAMGKQDVEFHERGYDLIHVPVGKDNADGKMIAVGSSIHEHYSTAKEVLVCSSDGVMTNLCNKLQQRGLVVYLVKKQGDAVKVHNSQTGAIKSFSRSATA
jgi:hypothetical protein